jgi:serine/threonine-protein kinase
MPMSGVRVQVSRSGGTWRSMNERLNAALEGRYRIERELGAGGMATVYLAEDLKHHRNVAVKVLRPELAAALGAERFLREIRTTANLRHPHILPLYDSGEADGFLYYIMPLVEGESLRDRLDRERQLSVDGAIRVAREVADALACAHTQGVLHRDIKPENILLERGHAILADFGIARALDIAGADQLTGTGLSLGTPAYMSPEQSLGEDGLDGRSDLYSLGCVLYEMLVGEPPHTGPSAHAIIAKRLSGTAPRVAMLRETVSPQLDAIVSRLLARAPADRFATADQLTAALSAAGIASPDASPRVRGVTDPQGDTAARGSTARRQPAMLRRLVARPMALRLLVVVVLAAIVAIGYQATRRGSAPDEGELTSDLLAVLPFQVRGSPDVAYLGEGIVDLMSVKLDGVGGLRVVNPRAVIALIGSQRIDLADPDAGSRVARSFGAGWYVVGDVVEIGGRLQLDARLYATSDSVPIVTATAEDLSDQLFAVVDSLAFSLIAGTLSDSVSRLERLATATTSSLAALEEYLRGERFIRTGAYRDAEIAYERAIAIDTAFALAYYRKSLVGNWTDAFDVRSSADKAVAYADRLAPRERSLVEALRTHRHGLSDEAENAYRTHLRRWPDDVEALVELGEILFHDGPRRGRSMTEAIPIYEEALRLEPSNVDARVHLARLYALTGELDKLTDDLRYFEIHAAAAATAGAEDRGGERLFEVQAMAAFATGDTAAQHEVVQGLQDKPWFYWFYASHGTSRFARDPAGAQALLERRTTREPLVEMIAANLHLVRGRPDAFRRFVAGVSGSGRVWWDVLEAFVWTSGATEPDTARMRVLVDRLRNADPAAMLRESWVPAYEDLTVPVHAFERDYTVALLQIHLGQIDDARQIIESMRSRDRFEALGNLQDDAIRSLEAEILLYSGDETGALEVLRGISYEVPHAATYRAVADGSRSRFLRAELELSHGDTAVAIGLYRGFDESWSPWDMYHRPVVYQRLGEIAESQGRAADAIRYYSWLVDLWRDADASLIDERDATRKRLEVLAGSRG